MKKSILALLITVASSIGMALCNFEKAANDFSNQKAKDNGYSSYLVINRGP